MKFQSCQVGCSEISPNRTGIALSVGAFEIQQFNRVTKLKLKI